MGPPRLLFFVAVSNLILYTCVAETLMRSAQARLYPLDSDPPEETLELWMERRSAEVDDDVTSVIDCSTTRRKAERKPRLWLLRALVCSQNPTMCRRADAADYNVDDETETGDNSADMFIPCLKLRCARKCRLVRPTRSGGQINDFDVFDDDCLGRCLQVVGGLSLESESESPRRKRKSHGMSFLTSSKAERERSPARKASLSRHHVTTRGHMSDDEPVSFLVNKRYRLGLYDCIASYCGELRGEDRKSCIINYCHRSSTLKM